MNLQIKLKLYAFFVLFLPVTAGLCNSNPIFIGKAEQLFAEGNFNDAIPLYQQMIRASSHPCQELILHLADCYLEISSPHDVLNLLINAPLSPDWESDRIYLLSSAYRRLNEHQKAINLLLSLSINQKMRLAPEIDLEKGLNLFHLKRISEARDYFQAVPWQPSTPHIYYLAQLYLARIALLERQTTKAGLILNRFDIPPNHPIAIEKDYLEGLIYFINNDYAEAIKYFEYILGYSLPKKASSSNPWVIPAQRYLISSYLHEANKNSHNSKQAALLLQNAQYLLSDLHKHSKEEIDHLLLGDFYLLKAQYLQDQAALQEAISLFSDTKLFSSPKARLHAALKLADTLPTYQDRINHYKGLLVSHTSNRIEQAEILYWSGMNALKEGLHLYQNNQSINQSLLFFENAAQNFEKAYSIFISVHSMQANQALKYYILATLFNASNQHLEESAFFLQELIEKRPPTFATWTEPEEIYFLTGLIWKRLAEKDKNAYPYAVKILNQVEKQFSSSKYALHAAKALGLLYLQHEEWQEAESVLTKLMEQQPDYPDAGLLLAMCAEKLNQLERKQFLLEKIFAQDPGSTAAPIAYFYTYSYREYLKGHRKAIKHLQSMPSLFSDHPLVISAHYLIGLDYLKDHLSNEGTLLRRKDFIAAIDAFQKSESTYESLYERKLISTEALPYFIQIRYRSMLERALANLAVAESSHGAKSQIYLEYAEGVFHQLIHYLQKPEAPVQELLIQNQSYPHFLKESYYWLAKTKLKKNQLEEAEQTLDLALQLYAQTNQGHGYLLSLIWYEKGKIAQTHQKHGDAIQFFQKSEEAGLAKPCLSPDQKLDLWIEQSLSYKELGDLENAMLLLSNAVNDEAISSLRVKAMYLRAELYELQGRPELACKQLEAVSKKGGEWGKLAKNKLENNYGV